MMLKLTPLSLMPHWLMVLKISFPIILLGKILKFIARNYLEGEGRGRTCPRLPTAPCPTIPNPPIPMAPCPTRTLPSTCGSPPWSPLGSVVTFRVHGHLHLLSVPCLSLPVSL